MRIANLRTASVVSRGDAIDAAFWMAVRTIGQSLRVDA
jgi:hypothetical protein